MKPIYKQKPRLNFPVVGSSAYFEGVGKKHYQSINNKSDKNLFNPELVPDDQDFSNWKLSQIRQEQRAVSGKKRVNTIQQEEQYLVKLGRDFDNKNIGLSSRKLRNQTENYYSIFTPLEQLHQKVNGHRQTESPNRNQKQFNNFYSPRAMNPTFISSRLIGP